MKNRSHHIYEGLFYQLFDKCRTVTPDHKFRFKNPPFPMDATPSSISASVSFLGRTIANARVRSNCATCMIIEDRCLHSWSLLMPNTMRFGSHEAMKSLIFTCCRAASFRLTGLISTTNGSIAFISAGSGLSSLEIQHPVPAYRTASAHTEQTGKTRRTNRTDLRELKSKIPENTSSGLLY